MEWRCYLLVAIWLLKGQVFHRNFNNTCPGFAFGGDASRPPFFDYDCACVKQRCDLLQLDSLSVLTHSFLWPRLTVADWNGIHREAMQIFVTFRWKIAIQQIS